MIFKVNELASVFQIGIYTNSPTILQHCSKIQQEIKLYLILIKTIAFIDLLRFILNAIHSILVASIIHKWHFESPQKSLVTWHDYHSDARFFDSLKLNNEVLQISPHSAYNCLF